MIHGGRTMANNICFYEIPGDDPERLQEFYGKIFDWQFDTKMSGYLHVTTDDGLTGGLPKKSTLTPPLGALGRINYITVDDVDKHCRIIADAGGKVVLSKRAVEGHGWYAVALDPEGNPFGIWKKDQDATNKV